MKSMPWCRRGVLAAGVLMTVLACSDEPPEADPPPEVPQAEAPPQAPVAPAAPDATGAAAPPSEPADTASWSVGITSAPSTTAVPPLPVLTDLRTSTHPEYERVTFEVAGAVDAPAGRPGYKLEYVDRPLIACGSGEQIFPVGDGWLEIRLEPAAAHTEAGQPTLGPREVDVGGPLLQRIYRTCDFEGIVTYVLALGSPNEYRVFTLADPLRIVVDVRR